MRTSWCYDILTWNFGVFTRFDRWGLQTVLRSRTSMFPGGEALA